MDSGVDIEVDSTIFPDAAQDKQDRTEFVVAVTGYLEKALMIGAQMPEAVPLWASFCNSVSGHTVLGVILSPRLRSSPDELVEVAKKKAAQAFLAVSGANQASD